MTTPTRLFSRGSYPEATRIAAILRKETIGGALLLVGTVIALVWANSPWAESYEALRDTRVGPESLHLDLTLGTWAADGLLAIFFFVVGLELKREFVAGDLRDPRRAALPVAAAVGGMVVPAVLFVLVNLGTGDGALRGWAIPTATDIAFALAVLAVISTHLPTALRTFLLTLAVVDDLLAITVIAIFYTSDLAVTPLLLSLVPLAVFGFLVQKRIRSWWLLIPLAVITWVLMHESGVHATVAGVLLAFTVPVVRSQAAGGPDAGPGLAEHLEHRIRPISAGFAVPVFAFFAAGVTIGGFSGLVESLSDPVAIGIVVGLVAGKTLGITGATWLVSRFTRAELDESLGWPDVIGLSMLAGIGFTVSLLIGALAYGEGSLRDEHVKVGVLVGTLTAAALASILLKSRDRRYRRIALEETEDLNADGVPDVYQTEDGRQVRTVDDKATHDPDWKGTPPPGRTAGPSSDT
ncbi:Na+/H+ antiporter NhaA [Modestobacter sp. VKM Ac-2979]|uniref:Na+/H+ antiporter NhaA n=1 Tax=unclassified Modestobacter TaxID=2643866 RepID=UPI0022AB5CC6|nr:MULTISPECIES: Na+/H+ antiporter NhaA [unclassified Modestobacter]MCZ2811436.1 Na+/H+ antiporter NhaA [Modestobacter sp. VKM Ac-2979]MCZ2840949.1 Na+/H+ antiporter NhaA [Modestobacter sp. VKM Ac-2980]